mmetsp:Transcript_65408/g.133043  ORF Transcript_65408/g.133043 Transcript_65408/m.133043 type:complete len:360 (+) Transcript_65408:2257-3336(+)
MLARTANDAAEIHGVPYFTSVGNSGRNSWEGTYKPGEACLEGVLSCHDFGDGVLKQRIKFTGMFGNIVFQWSEPFYSGNGPPGSPSDLDIFLLNTETGEHVMVFPPENNIGGDPSEIAGIYEGEFDLVIALVGGPAPELMKWNVYHGDVEADPPANAGTIKPHANTKHVAAVGAAFELQTFGNLEAEPFSSAGGSPVLFDRNGKRLAEPKVFDQPRFVGPDVSTALAAVRGPVAQRLPSTHPKRLFPSLTHRVHPGLFVFVASPLVNHVFVRLSLYSLNIDGSFFFYKMEIGVSVQNRKPSHESKIQNRHQQFIFQYLCSPYRDMLLTASFIPHHCFGAALVFLEQLYQQLLRVIRVKI